MTAQSDDVDATPAGRRMIATLLHVHDPLRADITALDRALEILADETADNTRIPPMIAGLTVSKFLWQLRVNCEFYCHALSAHHRLEDQRMFPVLLREFPELAPTMARLREEHDRIHLLIGETQSAASELTQEHSTVERAHAAISALAEHLRAHLRFEEESLFPYFLRMDTDWHLG